MIETVIFNKIVNTFNNTIIKIIFKRQNNKFNSTHLFSWKSHKIFNNKIRFSRFNNIKSFINYVINDMKNHFVNSITLILK